MNQQTNYLPEATVDNVQVRYAWLDRPDDKFGDAKHSITVIVDKEWAATLLKECNATKFNGLKEDVENPGVMTLKLSSKRAVKEGKTSFPRVDAEGNRTTEQVWSNDTVCVRFRPAVLGRDGSLSCYLEGVRIVEKAEREAYSAKDKAWGWSKEDVEQPQDDPDVPAADLPVETDDSIPF